MLNIIGSIASCFGLGVTIYVARRIYVIEKSYSAQALLPRYLKRMGGSLKNLEQHQVDKDYFQTRSELYVCRSTLIDLKGHLDPRRVKDVVAVIRTIDKLTKGGSDKLVWEEAGSVIALLKGVREMVSNSIEENKWKGRHAN